MGMTRNCCAFQEEVLELAGISLEGSSVLELGNQVVGDSREPAHPYCKTCRRRHLPAKTVYLNEWGAKEHVSFDWNGKTGAIPFDLNKEMTPLESAMIRDRFDVITNYGTIEHVRNQYQCFKTIHDAGKKNAIYIHTFPWHFPKHPNWTKHCRFYYTEECVRDLADRLNYKIIDISVRACYRPEEWSHTHSRLHGGMWHIRRTNLVYAAWTKTENSTNFISEKDFKEIDIFDSPNGPKWEYPPYVED